MKNLLFIVFFIPIGISAQQNCLGGKEVSEIFQANRISASFSPQGNKFLPRDGYFKVPFTSQHCAYTIFASSPWIGGFKDGELKIAAQRYAHLNSVDFYTGPLLDGAMTLDSNCQRYNRIWKVTGEEIQKHLDDFQIHGEITDTLGSVFGWPAEGNAFFSSINGFELESGHTGGWAEFYDRDANGIYEPNLGEYPCVFVNGIPRIPDEMMWMVFNDQGEHTYSKGLPLGVEIQSTVYGFNCTDNTVLSNALFVNYKVVNQNAGSIDSVYFGMWTDYDLGCQADDYEGCDTLRNTEFAYNRDEVDGETLDQCGSGLATYGYFPPIQSLTYLNQKMTSYIAAPWTGGFPYLPDECYHLLNGNWRDGTPITIHKNGYNPGENFPETKFLFSGDPRDTSQWSLHSVDNPFNEATTLSSVFLGDLQPLELVKIETVYMFHQDSSKNNIEQVGFMQYQIDSLIRLLDDTLWTCTGFPQCDDEDCVWPGDFNHNGIADQYDLLYWGVMKDNQGTRRDGKISWDGHFADPWALTLPEGLNAKHGDGNGDGRVDDEDIDRNTHHFLFTNPYYQPHDTYPPGPHIVLSAKPIDESGDIQNFKISAGIDMPDVLGMAYEIDYDTSLFTSPVLLNYIPANSPYLYFQDTNTFYVESVPLIEKRSIFSFVKTDHQGFDVPNEFLFQRSFGASGFLLRSGLMPDDIPDSTIIRLKNLIAIDANGNDLHIGSNPLVVYKEEIVGTHDPSIAPSVVYPNPCQDEIMIYVKVESNAEIVNIQGKKLKTISYFDMQRPVSVRDLVPGVYLIRILQTGQIIKLIVQ